MTEIKKEYAVGIRIAAVTAVCAYVLKTAGIKIQSLLEDMGSLSSASDLTVILFKGSIICIVTKLVCDLCKESGNNAVAQAIELTGRVMIIILSVPLIEAVIKTALSFIE